MGVYSPFVQHETTRLDLPNGQFLIVKKRLTAGETRKVFARMVKKMTTDGSTPHIELDPEQVGISQVLAYLVDWSFVAHDGQPIAIRGESPEFVASAVNNLEQADYMEVQQAIVQHEARMTAEREQEKKLRTGEKPSSPTSPSRTDSGGGTNGSETSMPMSTRSYSKNSPASPYGAE